MSLLNVIVTSLLWGEQPTWVVALPAKTILRITGIGRVPTQTVSI